MLAAQQLVRADALGARVPLRGAAVLPRRSTRDPLDDRMDARDARAREIQEGIGRILFEDWDPIGVGNQPDCAHEYDAYVGGVYRLLVNSASVEALAAHLAELEAGPIGLKPASPQALLPVARKLVACNVRL